MDHPNARELKALKNITDEWEHRAKLYAGEKTFAALIAKGWIVPFQGHNPNGDRYSITETGRLARSLGLPEASPSRPRLKTATPRLSEIKPGLRKLPPK
jgi:hypothetical protein